MYEHSSCSQGLFQARAILPSTPQAVKGLKVDVRSRGRDKKAPKSPDFANRTFDLPTFDTFQLAKNSPLPVLLPSQKTQQPETQRHS